MFFIGGASEFIFPLTPSTSSSAPSLIDLDTVLKKSIMSLVSLTFSNGFIAPLVSLDTTSLMYAAICCNTLGESLSCCCSSIAVSSAKYYSA
jgi:hypothetical protein